MFDREKRIWFKTVGELKRELKDIPDDTKIVICGDDNCWFHIETDGSVVCLDNEDLEDCYDGD